jgi:phage repressor protein C with HTH and peptisase S24 domain
VAAGAKRVLTFPSVKTDEQRVRLPIPVSAKQEDLIVATVVGDSLLSDDPSYNIEPGTQLVVNTRFNIFEVCDSLCAVRVFGCEEAAKYVHCNDDGTITLSSSNPDYPPETYDVSYVEIIGIVTGRHIPGKLKWRFV